MLSFLYCFVVNGKLIWAKCLLPVGIEPLCTTGKLNWGFHTVDEIGNNANIAIRGFNSAIHKVAGLTVPGHSIIWLVLFHCSTVPTLKSSVAGTASGGGSCQQLFWEWPVTKKPAALWIALLVHELMACNTKNGHFDLDIHWKNTALYSM